LCTGQRHTPSPREIAARYTSRKHRDAAEDLVTPCQHDYAETTKNVVLQPPHRIVSRLKLTGITHSPGRDKQDARHPKSMWRLIGNQSGRRDLTRPPAKFSVILAARYASGSIPGGTG